MTSHRVGWNEIIFLFINTTFLLLCTSTSWRQVTIADRRVCIWYLPFSFLLCRVPSKTINTSSNGEATGRHQLNYSLFSDLYRFFYVWRAMCSVGNITQVVWVFLEHIFGQWDVTHLQCCKLHLVTEDACLSLFLSCFYFLWQFHLDQLHVFIYFRMLLLCCFVYDSSNELSFSFFLPLFPLPILFPLPPTFDPPGPFHTIPLPLLIPHHLSPSWSMKIYSLFPS